MLNSWIDISGNRSPIISIVSAQRTQSLACNWLAQSPLETKVVDVPIESMWNIRMIWNCLKHDLIMNLNQLKFLYHKVGSDQVIISSHVHDKWNKWPLSQSRFSSNSCKIRIWDFIHLKVHRTKRGYFETLILIMPSIEWVGYLPYQLSNQWFSIWWNECNMLKILTWDDSSIVNS